MTTDGTRSGPPPERGAGHGIHVAGAVLAGGRSRRFGADKALHPVDGQPMVAHVVRALRDGGADPVVVVGGDRERLAGLGLGLGLLADRWPGEGPLGGLLTALGTAGGGIAVVAACDLPFVDGATVRSLVAVVAAGDAAVAVADAGRVQPLLGAWQVAAVAAVLEAAFADGLRSMEDALAALVDAGLVVTAVPVPAGRLVNVNRVDDLAR